MATFYTIAQMLDSINGEQIGSGGFSDFSYLVINTGDKGSEFKEKINTNFFNNAGDHQAFYETFESVISALNKRIMSEEILQIKIEDNKLLYTVDGSNWIPLIDVKWGSITGDSVLNQKDLAEILNSKATNKDLNSLSATVSANSSNITDLTKTSSDHELRIGDLEDDNTVNKSDIQQLKNNVSNRVAGNGIKQIKESAGKVYFSFQDATEANPTWTPITVGTSAQVSWGNILGGDPLAQLDLKAEFEKYALSSLLTAHTTNVNNPHNVTVEQLGLDKVDNTSDMDKPISDAVALKFEDYMPAYQINSAFENVYSSIDGLQGDINDIIGGSLPYDEVMAHLADNNNPHAVTKEQLGLDQVDNTADIDKPISRAVSEAISNLMVVDYISAFHSITKEDYNFEVEDGGIEPSAIYYIEN